VRFPCVDRGNESAEGGSKGQKGKTGDPAHQGSINTSRSRGVIFNIHEVRSRDVGESHRIASVLSLRSSAALCGWGSNSKQSENRCCCCSSQRLYPPWEWHDRQMGGPTQARLPALTAHAQSVSAALLASPPSPCLRSLVLRQCHMPMLVPCSVSLEAI